GAKPDLSPAHSEVLQLMGRSECHFINGTERVRYVGRLFYNREQFLHFDSDVGHFVGDTPYGEKVTTNWNNDLEYVESKRTAVDWFCRCSYESYSGFSVNRRVPPSVSISLVPSSSQPGPGRLLCS
ncbi:HB24 protein, partial [Xiphorhynchus elegans]|nr:HB24 protein [Xiphorhynchus elegans]